MYLCFQKFSILPNKDEELLAHRHSQSGHEHGDTVFFVHLDKRLYGEQICAFCFSQRHA